MVCVRVGVVGLSTTACHHACSFAEHPSLLLRTTYVLHVLVPLFERSRATQQGADEGDQAGTGKGYEAESNHVLKSGWRRRIEATTVGITGSSCVSARHAQ